MAKVGFEFSMIYQMNFVFHLQANAESSHNVEACSATNDQKESIYIIEKNQTASF